MRLQPFIGSRSATPQDLDLSLTHAVYITTNNHIKKSSCPNTNICGFQSHITAKTTRRRPVRSTRQWLQRLQPSSQTHQTLHGATQGEQRNNLVPHMTTLNQNSHMATPDAHIRAGRGPEPAGRQGPETPPKCRHTYGPRWATAISKPMLPKKHAWYPPLNLIAAI